MLGAPSMRLPMPFRTESSTVEWHSAQVTPSFVMWPFASTSAFNPTTALSLSNETVVFGSLRSAFSSVPGGSASESTFNPTSSAVVGSTFDSTTSCNPSLSVQSRSSPKVSKRKMRLPSLTSSAETGSAIPTASIIPIATIPICIRVFMWTPKQDCGDPTPNFRHRDVGAPTCAGGANA
jgi:hypothetical protein